MSLTIQTVAVKKTLDSLSHATNQALHLEVKKDLPTLSLPSLHRITNRLVDNKEIGYVPSDGRVVILDANPNPHDHFVCKICGRIKDIELPGSVFDNIHEQLGKNIVENRLVIYGVCVDCNTDNTPMT